MNEKTDAEKLAAYEQMREGSRKGGRAPKHFTPESKQRQIEGARRGGSQPKHYTSESKRRQIENARKGGLHRWRKIADGEV